jgi:hypothetical protein
MPPAEEGGIVRRVPRAGHERGCPSKSKRGTTPGARWNSRNFHQIAARFHCCVTSDLDTCLNMGKGSEPL